MKKNKWMRLASLLLILCLVTTCTVSGTYAKYITVDSAVDTARVAKFGVVATAEGNLFGPTYTGGEGVAHPHSIVAYGVNTESVSSFDKADVVAPGVDNDKGLSLSVVGKPEVSTRLVVDVPEDSGKKYVNTDIYLKKGDYSIMLEIDASKISMTADNCGDYYSYADKAFAKLTAPVTSGTVYKRIQLTGANTASTMSADYYPIQWDVNGTPLTNATDALTEVKKELCNGSDTGILSRKPNEAWTAAANSAVVTWKWDYGTAWADGSSDTTLPNWENTALTDLEDTVLGQMIALAVTDSDVTPTYKVALGLDEVQYKTIPAVDGAANNVIVAYVNSPEPSSWNAANVACLTVSFGVRLTVTQID